MRGDSALGGSVAENLPYSCDIGVAVFGNKKYTIDKNERVNLSYTAEVDINLPEGSFEKAAVSPGAEAWINDLFGLRAGIKNFSNLTFGFSFKYGMFRFDYAFISDKDLENRNILSSSLYF
jgi:hypothetical protein